MLTFFLHITLRSDKNWTLSRKARRLDERQYNKTFDWDFGETSFGPLVREPTEKACHLLVQAIMNRSLTSVAMRPSHSKLCHKSACKGPAFWHSSCVSSRRYNCSTGRSFLENNGAERKERIKTEVQVNAPVKPEL